MKVCVLNVCVIKVCVLSVCVVKVCVLSVCETVHTITTETFMYMFNYSHL